MTWLQSFEPFILTLHFLICIFMVIVILLQAGKGADMGAAFGAGGSQSLFGARGASTLLSKITTVAALMFLVTSLTLSTISKNRLTGGVGKSAVESLLKDQPAKPVPAEKAVAAPEQKTEAPSPAPVAK